MFSIRFSTKKTDFFNNQQPNYKKRGGRSRNQNSTEKQNNPIKNLYNNLSKSGKLPDNLSFADFSREHKKRNRRRRRKLNKSTI